MRRASKLLKQLTFFLSQSSYFLSLSLSYHFVLEVRLSSNLATIKPAFLTYLQEINWNKIHNDDERSNGLCGVGLLNDSGCRSGTQGQRLRDVEGSMASGCCGGESNVENGVTSIETRQLRKYHDNGFDTMLKILNE